MYLQGWWAIPPTLRTVHPHRMKLKQTNWYPSPSWTTTTTTTTSLHWYPSLRPWIHWLRNYLKSKLEKSTTSYRDSDFGLCLFNYNLSITFSLFKGNGLELTPVRHRNSLVSIIHQPNGSLHDGSIYNGSIHRVSVGNGGMLNGLMQPSSRAHSPVPIGNALMPNGLYSNGPSRNGSARSIKVRLLKYRIQTASSSRPRQSPWCSW